MKARELKSGDWFRWDGDWRVFRRLDDGLKTIEGQECIHVQPLQPTANIPAGYIPADDEVSLYKEHSICLS